MNEYHSRKFVLIFLTTLVSLLSFIAAINWLIDPFNFFNHSTWENLNAVKISLDKQQRMHRAIEIARYKPTAILLGSSRPMVALNPDDFSFAGYSNVYNASFSGANIEEITAYFEHALYHQPHLKLAVIGIDLFAFGKYRDPQKDFSLKFLKGGLMSCDRIFSILFSKKGLMSSYETWKENQKGSAIPFFLKNGQTNPDSLPIISHEELEEKDLEYLKIVFSSVSGYLDYEFDDRKIEMLRSLVNKCRKHEIDLKLFLCPTKAVYWEALYSKDLWTVFEEFKKRLCCIHPIWDFSGYNCVTTEMIDDLKDPLYYECSHFRPRVGKMIIERLFGTSQARPDFGYYLTPDDVEAAMNQIRVDREKWLQKNPPILKKLGSVFI